MKLTNIIILLSLFISQAFAADISAAKIDTLMLDRGHGAKVYIKLNKTHSTPINCQTNSWQYVLDISDELGKIIYSSLLASYAAGKTVNFIGTTSCSLHLNIETLRRIELI